jgi:hypothetical protein
MSKTSEKQLKANRRNATLGGVKTLEGKAVSRYNATRHGILREAVTEYEKVAYKEIFNDVYDYFKPRNFVEEMLVERIVVCYVKFVRLSKAESEMMKSVIDPTVPFGSIKMNDKDGYESVVKYKLIDVLADTYTRYEAGIENRLYKAIDKLRELKRESV